MTRRKRKKEPPDLRLSPFDSPPDRSSPVDLANSLLNSGFSFQPFHFHCSSLDYGYSALPNSSQVHFLSQPVVGIHRRLCWFRIHRLSTMIQMELCILTSRVCDGLAGYRRGSSLASIMGSLCQAPRRSRHLQASLFPWSWPYRFRCPTFCTFVDCRHKRLCRLFFTVHKLPDWQLITVSSHFRIWVVKSEIQHLWVLGMCLLVLGLHLMMLAHALQGLCSSCCPLDMRTSWPIRGWFLLLSLILTIGITIQTLSSYCNLDYSVKEKLRLSYVDILLKDSSSRSLASSRTLKCIKDDTVLFSSGCIFSSALSCTRYFVSVFEQHCSYSVYECILSHLSVVTSVF